jgi:hypothetical protein
MQGRPIEGERTAPVVTDQNHAVQVERVEPGVEVAGVVTSSPQNRQPRAVRTAWNW